MRPENLIIWVPLAMHEQLKRRKNLMITVDDEDNIEKESRNRGIEGFEDSCS
jgi:hypothetical protein